ncbi:MAG TPA: DinB family protein [Bryobacteraceae bacterium]|nr:DinB family protein [Bryobacteraceae bacterium]
MKLVALAILAGALASAQSFDPKMPESVPKVEGRVVEQATLRYIDIRPGDGAVAAPGQQYFVHYTGWLRDGTQFDSSAGKDPLKFVQGRREVIAGFDVGFEGMKVGGKRRLFIPYQLAYGDQQRGKIPPRSELIFDIELVAVKDAPPASAGAELLLPFTELQEHVLALAKAIPEEKYSWRPGPGVRSFREVFLHIVLGNEYLLNIANNAPSMDELRRKVAENERREKEPVSKEKLIQMLTENFATVKQTFDSARAASLNRTVDYTGTLTTRRGVLTKLDTHLAEHAGQLIAYARVNGIVPPWAE